MGSPQSIFHTMRASAACRIRKDKQTKDGLAAVYLQIRINGVNTHLPLEISWPVLYFDNKQGEFLPRSKSDQLSSDHTLYARQQLAKSNEIFVQYRLRGVELTVELFHREFVRFGLRDNFLAWAAQHNEDRYAAAAIENQTYRNIKSQLKKVSSWKSEILFSELSKELLANLQVWLMKKQRMSAYGAWAILKTMKSEAVSAAAAGMSLNLESVQRYRLPATQGRVIYLTEVELKRLWHYYRSEDLAANHRLVLRAFLFATLTGLRFSDIERVSWKEILGEHLIFVPHKTRNLSKRLSLLVPEDAWTLIETDQGRLFHTATQQNHNQLLKEIGKKCGVRKVITTHVARHTFATECLRSGIPVQVLQQLMGHSKISTTMIYVHVSSQDRDEAMRRLQAPR